MATTEPLCQAISAARRGGVILILVVGMVSIVAVMATGFLGKMRQKAGAADDTVRAVQNRLMLNAAMHYIQEASRVGYATINPDGTTAAPREAFGWIQTRVFVPEDAAFTAAGFTNAAGGAGVPENWESRRIGPRAADGTILWPWKKESYDTSGISAIEVTAGGDYTIDNVPTISFSGGGGSGVAARPIIDFDDSVDPPAGPVTHVTITSSGSGYTSAPSVSFSHGTAAATAHIYWGRAVPETTDAAGNVVGPQWPALGSHMRAPMYRIRRPPYAVGLDVVRNPIPTDHSQPTFGIPFLNNVDPLPEFSDADVSAYAWSSPDPSSSAPSDPSKTLYQVWAEGDEAPVANSATMAWFRVYREDGTEPGFVADGGRQALGDIGTTFIVTVGSGGTLGYRDWAEVQAEGAEAVFDGSQALFEQLEARELRHWYRVAWAASVGGGEDHVYAFATGQSTMAPQDSWYEQLPINASRHIENGSRDQSSASLPRNYIGTIRDVQRLDGPPDGNGW